MFGFFDLLESLYVFMSGTVPHAVFVKMQKLISPHCAPRELKKLSDTRWSCRTSSIVDVKDTFPALLLTLGHLVDDDDNEIFFSFFFSKYMGRGR